MVNILLLSRFPEVKEKVYGYLQEHSASQEILFIPTASSCEQNSVVAQRAFQGLQQLGYQVSTLDLIHVSRRVAIERINQASTLYIAGGNTFFLLQAIQEKELSLFLKERAKQGMVYIGESAGAMIASKDVTYSQYLDSRKMGPKVINDTALGLIPFYLIPHYYEKPYSDGCRKIEEKYGNKCKIVGINNNECLIYNGSDYTIL